MDTKKPATLSKRAAPFRPYTLVMFLLIAFLILIVSCTRCSFGSMRNPKQINILSYNTENLFDDIDNGTEYPEYDPGAGEWDSDAYYVKMMNIAQVIRASCENGPDIVALQEIENDNVLEDLKENFLAGMGYRETVIPEAENSAVQCAFISKYPVSRLKTHALSVNGYERNRFILEAGFLIGGRELIIFNNHWKSKSGGAEETEEQRIEAAGIIRRRLFELAEKDSRKDALVLGDLNENADEYIRIEKQYQTALLPMDMSFQTAYFRRSLAITSVREKACIDGDQVVLYSPWGELPGEGSYIYGGLWETIDHALLPPALFDDSGFTFESFTVIKEDFMLTDRGFPFRWNSENRSGYSDHFPILVTLTAE